MLEYDPEWSSVLRIGASQSSRLGTEYDALHQLDGVLSDEVSQFQSSNALGLQNIQFHCVIG